MKISNAEKNKLLARTLFVDGNKSTKDISDILVLTEKTVQNYQSRDKKDGFDWLSLRASKHIQATETTKENMYSMFVTYMYDSLREIRENDKLAVDQKASLIVSLGDSFSKMRKVAAAEDPEAYTLGIVKHTTKTILSSLKKTLPKECMEKVIETIHDIQEDLSNVSI